MNGQRKMVFAACLCGKHLGKKHRRVATEQAAGPPLRQEYP